MRITNKMMSNNSLTNINRNKEYLDKLNNQMASEKKITRPSDDPVIAIRALKLRSNVTELTQYYDKNTNDAQAWLTATQDAIESTKGILISMKGQITTGATGTNTVESRNAILSELKALKDQVYDDGNADYAGRSLFTGYRTSTRLSVQEQDLPMAYSSIEQSLSRNDMDQVTYITGKIKGNGEISSADSTPIKEQRVDAKTFSRLKIAYSDVDQGSVSNITITDSNGNPIDSISVISKNRNNYATFDEYMDAVINDITDSNAAFIPETGEIILGKNQAAKVAALSDTDKLTVNYAKSNWKAGDLRPEHYFTCRQKVLDKNGNQIDSITYDNDKEQAIYYDISTNQQLQINTYASDVFVHGIGRDIEEMISAIEEANEAEYNVSKLEKQLSELDPDTEEYENVQLTIKAANKQKSYVDDKLQRLFEHGLTTFADYIDKATLAGTAVGSTIERLDLVKNRLMDLKTTAKELADDNENVELTDIVINVSQAELTYNAALMATGKISQQTLLNYI